MLKSSVRVLMYASMKQTDGNLDPRQPCRRSPKFVSVLDVVLHLCSVSELSGAPSENRRILYRQNEVQETLLSLFPIYRHLPKLDFAGSNPVSRSIFSITCIPRQISFCLICLNLNAMSRIAKS